jgi:hypothetical protein
LHNSLEKGRTLIEGPSGNIGTLAWRGNDANAPKRACILLIGAIGRISRTNVIKVNDRVRPRVIGNRKTPAGPVYARLRAIEEEFLNRCDRFAPRVFDIRDIDPLVVWHSTIAVHQMKEAVHGGRPGLDTPHVEDGHRCSFAALPQYDPQ